MEPVRMLWSLYYKCKHNDERYYSVFSDAQIRIQLHPLLPNASFDNRKWNERSNPTRAGLPGDVSPSCTETLPSGVERNRT